MKKILSGFGWIIIIFVVAILIANISTNSVNSRKSKYSEYNYPSSYMVKDENNYFDYQPGYECSAFSSAYLLRHYGVSATGLELYKTYPDKVTGGGVYARGLVNFFKQRGYQIELIEHATVDDLKQELSLGHPVIVYIHAEPVTESVHYTHYVPLVGYDEDSFYFAESLDYLANYKDQNLPYNRKTDIKTFEELWVNVDGIYDQPYFSIQK